MLIDTFFDKFTIFPPKIYVPIWFDFGMWQEVDW